MEEHEINQRFHSIFEASFTALTEGETGFYANNFDLVKKSISDFQKKITASTPYVEQITTDQEKGPSEKRVLLLVLAFQPIALALDSLLNKMLIKTEAGILFSEKAQNEIRSLIEIMRGQLKDTKDYILTKNNNLLKSVIKAKNELIDLAVEYDLVHQDRLISGVCMPKASYLYIEMTHSIKRIARGLVDFVEKV